jgi:hypothetical protein
MADSPALSRRYFRYPQRPRGPYNRRMNPLLFAALVALTVLSTTTAAAQGIAGAVPVEYATPWKAQQQAACQPNPTTHDQPEPRFIDGAPEQTIVSK